MKSKISINKRNVALGLCSAMALTSLSSTTIFPNFLISEVYAENYESTAQFKKESYIANVYYTENGVQNELNGTSDKVKADTEVFVKLTSLGGSLIQYGKSVLVKYDDKRVYEAERVNTTNGDIILKFTMPRQAVNIYIDEYPSKDYNITNSEIEYISDVIVPETNGLTADKGDNVQLILTDEGKLRVENGYAIAVTYKLNGETMVKQVSADSNGEYHFTMVGADVSLSTGELISVTDIGTPASSPATQTHAIEGETILVTKDLSSQYNGMIVIASPTNSGDGETFRATSSNSLDWEFVMPSYPVTLNSVQTYIINASTSLTLSQSRGFAGETITITPKSGVSSDEVINIYENNTGNPINLTSNSDGTSSFKMPESAVTISLDKVPRALSYDDDIVITNPKVDINNTTLSSGGQIYAGTSITAEANPSNNQVVVQYPTSDSSSFERLVESSSSGKYEFTMPNYNMTLKIVDTYNINIDHDDIESVSLTKAAKNEVVEIKLNTALIESKDIYVVGDNSGSTSIVSKINDSTYSFIMLEEDVSISITDRVSRDKTVSYTDSNILSVSYNNGIDISSGYTKIPEDEIVTVVFDNSIGQESLLVTNSAGTIVNSLVNVKKLSGTSKDTFIFNMPSYDVKLSYGLNDSNSEDENYEDDNVVLFTTDLAFNFVIDEYGYISKANVLTGKFNGTLEISEGFDFYQPIKNLESSDQELNDELQTGGTFIGFAPDFEIVYGEENPYLENQESENNSDITFGDVKNLIISQDDFEGDLNLALFTGLTSLNLSGFNLASPEEDGYGIAQKSRIILSSSINLTAIALPSNLNEDEVAFLDNNGDYINFSNITFVASTTTSQNALIAMGVSNNYGITLSGLHILGINSNYPTGFDLSTKVDPTQFIDLYAYSPNKFNSSVENAVIGFIKINYDTSYGSTQTFENTIVPKSSEKVEVSDLTLEGEDLEKAQEALKTNYANVEIDILDKSNFDEQNRFIEGGHNSLNIIITGSGSGLPLANKTLTSPLFDLDVASFKVDLKTNDYYDQSSILAMDQGITVSVSKTDVDSSALTQEKENILEYNWYYANTKNPSDDDYIKISNTGNILSFNTAERAKILDKKYIFCEVYDPELGEARMGNAIYVDISLTSSEVTLSSHQDLYSANIQISGTTSGASNTLVFNNDSSTNANTKSFDTNSIINLSATHAVPLKEDKEVKWSVVSSDITGTTSTKTLRGDNVSFEITSKMSYVSVYAEVVDIVKYQATVAITPEIGGDIKYYLSSDYNNSGSITDEEIEVELPYGDIVTSVEIIYVEEEEGINFIAIPNDGYTFAGWTVSGDFDEDSEDEAFTYTLPYLNQDVNIYIKPTFKKIQDNSSSGSGGNSSGSSGSSGSSSSSGSGNASSSYNSSSSSNSILIGKPTPTPEELLENLAGSTDNLYKTDYTSTLAQYKDVQGHWAYSAIGFVMKEGYFMGTSENTFSPEGMMTRAMVVTTLSRVAQVNTSILQNSDTFKDISSDMWYTGAVNWALENNITRGISNTEFDPDGPVTREQMAVFFLNFANLIGLDIPMTSVELNFKDVDDISFWAADAIIALNDAGVLIGNPDGTFKPQGTATRAEVATMVVRFLDLIK
ncbi:MAG: S-layer homology domain-containing protein [bacterium]